MDITQLNTEQLLMIANRAYPVDKRKDTDGDWYDRNQFKRECFIVGFKTAMGMAKDDF